MIIVKLKGGLGNQMFQYAFGYALAKNKGVRLCVCFEKKAGIERNYGLNRFGVRFKLPVFVVNRILIPFFEYKTYKEKTIGFDNIALIQSNKTIFDGYWQSYKYFLDCVDDIRMIFDLNFKSEYLLKKNSVSVHVRATDYVGNKAHDICDKKYYKKAINVVKKKIKNPIFYVFTDDVDWVKKNYKFMKDYNFVSGLGYKDYEEMSIMSKCEHNIIANSSFSWWGAWLNKHKNNIVIAPKKWFRNTQINIDDRLPKEWMKI